MNWTWACARSLGIWIAVGPGLAFAQDTVDVERRVTVAGCVVDGGSGQPLEGAWVTAVDDGTFVATDAEGRFALEGRSGTDLMIRIEAAGYSTTVERVYLRPGIDTYLHVALLRIDRVVDYLQIRARSPDPGRAEPEHNPWDVLEAFGSGRLQGALLLRGGGQVGANNQLLIRGVKTLTLGSDPLIYLDGIRLTPVGLSPAKIREANARILDALDPSTIAHIEVLRGPSATALYPDAGNGVVVITSLRPGR